MRVESQGMTVVSVVGEIVFVMTTTDPGMLEVMIVPGIVVMIVNPGTRIGQVRSCDKIGVKNQIN